MASEKKLSASVARPLSRMARNDPNTGPYITDFTLLTSITKLFIAALTSVSISALPSNIAVHMPRLRGT